MSGTESAIEAVARAFYDLQDCARGWDREPERLKERFLCDAWAAVAVHDEYRCSPGSDLTGSRVCGNRDGRRRFRKRGAVALVVHTDPPDEHRETAVARPIDTAFRACSEASLNAAMLVARSRDLARRSRARIARSLTLLRRTARVL